jgi:hypothetical protein
MRTLTVFTKDDVGLAISTDAAFPLRKTASRDRQAKHRICENGIESAACDHFNEYLHQTRATADCR